MNKSELIDAISADVDMPKAHVSRVLESFTSNVTKTLATGDSVTLVGFGTFQVKFREARTGRHPQTGAPMEIKASSVPGFKAGKALKDAVA